MDFVAVDVETANADQRSICAVGIVTFEGGRIAAERHTLVDPEDEFSPHHTRLHGIAAHHVAGAPRLPEVLGEIGKIVGGGTLVHHGSFDRTAFLRAKAHHGLTPWPCHWLDTVVVARRAWPEFRSAGGHGLKVLAPKLGIPLDRHHDPLEDARAAGRVLLAAAAKAGHDLAGWHARVLQPIGASPNGAAAAILAEIASDEVIVFTGALERALRREAEAQAQAAGFNVGKSVTRKTTILVVGDGDARGRSGMSEKHRTAEDLVDKGGSIRIVTESDFWALIQPES